MLTKHSKVKMVNECKTCEGKGKIILKYEEAQCFDCDSKGEFEFNISIEQLIAFVKWNEYNERTREIIINE